MRKVLMLFSMFILSIPTGALADIKGNADLFIKVSKLDHSHRKFELCSTDFSKGPCNKIGNQDSYLVKDLNNQKWIEVSEAILSVPWTLSIVFAGVAILCGAPEAAIWFIPTATIESMRWKVNRGLITQFKQAYVMRSAVIDDKDIILNVNNAYIINIAKRLHDILENIDQYFTDSQNDSKLKPSWFNIN